MSAPSVASPTPLPPMSSPSSMHQMHPQHPTITVQSPPAVGSITAASPSPATSIPSANITSQPTSTSTSTSSSSSSSHSHSSHSSTSTSTSTSTSPPHGHSHSEQKSPPEIFPSVRVADFHEHVKRQQTLIDGAFDQFDIEMEVLQQMSLQPHFVRKIHTPSQHNLKKNRYVNVLPHDPSRVHLSIIDGDPHSDYINASHVKPSLPGANTHYIAAQAPIPLTFVDWWRMIWEQKCNIVLMLTREKERDRQDKEQSKAHRYWPEDGKSQEFGNITVTMTEKNEEGDTIIRIFQLQRGGETRQVVHLQYIGWPDHGVPEEYSSFTKLFQIYRSYRDQGVTGPVLTHCSAGIGRTGTFCALDMILDNISKKRDGSGNSTINVFNIVRALRDSRPGMVQSKAQYAFCSFFLDHCIQNHLFDAS